VRQVPHAQQHVAHRGGVQGGSSVRAEQGNRAPQAVDQVLGVCIRQRGQSGGAVGDQVGVDPAEAEHHQRTERGVGVRPDQQFPAVGGHRLQQHTAQRGPEAAPQLLDRGPDIVGGPDVEDHAALLAFVHDALGDGLDRDGTIPGARHCLGVGRGRREAGIDHWNAEAAQQSHRVDGIEPAAGGGNTEPVAQDL
jgi:hypothetical protein